MARILELFFQLQEVENILAYKKRAATRNQARICERFKPLFQGVRGMVVGSDIRQAIAQRSTHRMWGNRPPGSDTRL